MKLEPVAWTSKSVAENPAIYQNPPTWPRKYGELCVPLVYIPEGYVVVPKEAKPTMQEIEGLVYKLEAAVETSVLFDKATNVLAMQEARAALMAAIRQLSNSTQDGE